MAVGEWIWSDQASETPDFEDSAVIPNGTYTLTAVPESPYYGSAVAKWCKEKGVPYYFRPDSIELQANPPELMYKYIPYMFTPETTVPSNEDLYFGPDYTAFEAGVNFAMKARNAADLNKLYAATADFTIKPKGIPIINHLQFAAGRAILKRLLFCLVHEYDRARKRIGRKRIMKSEIHPTYTDCKVTCACGNSFETKSTKAEIRLDVCSACHPYFTGQQKFVNRGGRVEKFKSKYNID